MKRFWVIFALILSLCLAVFFTASRPYVSEGPRAENGVIDFSGTDFSASVYALQGQWEFYYSKLYTPEDLEKGISDDREMIELPGPWTKKGYPGLGYATYRLTVRTGDEKALLLYIPEIMSSSVVWVNGDEIFRAGSVGTSAGETTPGVRNDLLSVVPEDGTLELVIQSANYHMNGSGLFYSVIIGRDTVLTHCFMWQRIAVAAALGGILLMGAYHLFLYFFRRRERMYLTFSLICLTTVLRLGMESNSLYQYFMPRGIGPVMNRVFLELFVFHSLCICIFMLQAFSIRLGRVLRVIYSAAFILPVIGICLLPYASAVNCMFVVMIPYVISVVLVLRSGKIGKDPYKLLYLCGLITFLLYGPLTKTVFEGALFVPAVVPNLFLILTQCVMLSRNYAEAHNEVERINANLELLVEQRTAELNRANQYLASSQAALREMIANISHDLKTPLTVLNNYLEILGDESIVTDDRERAEYLGIAYHKNLDLQRLIHNLFEITRMEGGTLVYRKEWLNAGQLMEEAECKYGEQVRNSGLEFYAEADDGVELEADSNRIWSVLDNLVYNAIRHTPEGGSIAVSIQRDGEKAVLSVKDTGTGIAAEHLSHIFERFYKVSKERGQKDGSSGLGLYIVRTATEAMGGTVTVKSEPGKGSEFILTFSAR
ncbi:MAG: sensor histidine kinase [Eubacteriales bacterium]|nr:sensor histidine kinase [Eubacteriales bacterium]